MMARTRAFMSYREKEDERRERRAPLGGEPRATFVRTDDTQWRVTPESSRLLIHLSVSILTVDTDLPFRAPNYLMSGSLPGILEIVPIACRNLATATL